jgi:hypothetical protein
MVYFRRFVAQNKKSRLSMKFKYIVFCMLITLLVVACGAPAPTPRLSPIPAQLSPLTSPLSVPTNSAVPFHLDRPVVAGTAVIRGTGPAGVPIWIADVTFMGEVLGQGKIGPDGKFAIQVQPLDANHRIGVALAELAGTPWTAEDFYRAEFYGPDATQAPQVGFFFDTVMVTEK